MQFHAANSSVFQQFYQPARQIPMTVHGAAQPKQMTPLLI
jgi:hypothetical protein